VVEYLIQIKPGPVGILGTSLGAITSSLVLSIDPRVTAGVLIVGDGPVSLVLSSSKIKKALDLKKTRMEELNLRSQQEYQQKLEESITIDPISRAQNAAPKNVWMFIGSRDTIVPTETQWKLRDAWKKPRYNQAFLDHTEMIIFTYIFWGRSIRDYFVENLKPSKGAIDSSPRT
jgi:dienelactone hydrolase